MGTATTTANSILLLVLNATTWANVAINATSSPITIVAAALHTADPGAGGTQQTNEVAYTSYARVSTNRNSSSGGWTVTTNSASPATVSISFPAGTGGSGTATYWSTGPTASGATAIFWSGTVTPNIVCGNGVTPQLTTASTITIT